MELLDFTQTERVSPRSPRTAGRRSTAPSHPHKQRLYRPSPPPSTETPNPPRPARPTTPPPDADHGPDLAHAARHQAAGTGRSSRLHQPTPTEASPHAAATAAAAGTADLGRQTHRTSRQHAAAEPRHRRARRRAQSRARWRAHSDARDTNAADSPPRHRRPGRQAATTRHPRHRGTQPTTPPPPRRQGRTTKATQDLQGEGEWGTSLYRDPGAALSRVAGRSSEPPCPSPGAACFF